MASIMNQTSIQSPPLRGKLNHIKELLEDASDRLNQEAKVFTTKASASATTNLKGRNGNHQHLPPDELRRTIADISTIQSVLACPIFDHIANLTDSLDKLSYHLNLRPSIGPSDIEFNDKGEIILAPPIEPTSLNNLINNRLDDLSNSQQIGPDRFSVDIPLHQLSKQNQHNIQQQSKPTYCNLPIVAQHENEPTSITSQNEQIHEQMDLAADDQSAKQSVASNQQNNYDTERLVAHSRETNYVNGNRQRNKEPSKVQSVVAVFENAEALTASNNNGRRLYKANGYQALNQVVSDTRTESDHSAQDKAGNSMIIDDSNQNIGYTNQLYKSTNELINPTSVDEADNDSSRNPRANLYANGSRDQQKADRAQVDLASNGRMSINRASENKRVSPSTSAGSTVRLADECDSGTSSFRSKGALYSPQSQKPIDHLDDDQMASSSAHSSIDQELIEKLSGDMERIKVTLEKDSGGLGITIAGYTCEQEEISGIFIKSITPGSPADKSGKIRILDQIFAVNGQEILAYSNPEAVNVLRRQTGRVVTLELMRYLAESKYRKLQTLLDRAEPSSNLQKSPNIQGYQAAIPMEVDVQPSKAQPVMSTSSPKCYESARTESVYNNTSVLLEQKMFDDSSTATSPMPVAAQRSAASKVIETKQGARNKIDIKSPLCQATYANEVLPLELNNSYNTNNIENIANRLNQETDEFSRSVDTEKLNWEKNVQIVSLRKESNQSLGFAIKDYVNPENPHRWIFMIISITPNSITDIDGQLSVGDLLVFVDDINLEYATPEQAARALRRASGEVRLGVLKYKQQR